MKDCEKGELFCTTEGRYDKDVVVDIPAACEYLRKQREEGRKREDIKQEELEKFIVKKSK